jgi:hypothetical protein
LVKSAIASDSDGNYFIVEEERIRVSKNVWVGKHGGLPAKQLTGLISFPDGQKRYVQYWNEDFWCGLETEVTTHDAVRNRRILLRNDMSHNPGVEKMKNELSSPELLPKMSGHWRRCLPFIRGLKRRFGNAHIQHQT